MLKLLWPITANEPMTEGQNAQSLSVPILNEQSNANLNDKEEEEKECDCDDCVYIIVDDDDSETVQCIEDNIENEESSRPAKKLRLDTTQPNSEQVEVIGESSEQPTQSNQVNSPKKQIITIRLRCLLSNCPDTFLEDQLNDHMSDKHDLGTRRCLVKGCRKSFNNRFKLGEHLAQSHKSTSQWHCDNCAKHYPTYHQLSVHNLNHHQLGQFQCSFSACTFTGELRRTVYNHYSRKHKRTLNCQHCHYRTTNPGLLELHEHTHFRIRPYRCKWSGCNFAATQPANTIKHIRVKHLAPSPGSVPTGQQLDPKDYVEVVESNQQPTQPNQVNNQEKQFNTLSLQCLQSNCFKTFAQQSQLNDHLNERHHLGPSACAVKYCGQAFENKRKLGDHIKQAHQHTSQWHCDKCNKHYPTYPLLSDHTRKLHHLGLFHCLYPSCTFTGQYRTVMYSHYANQHKQTLMVSCQHFGCHFRTSNAKYMKIHERIHSGIKPYRCNWLNCDYAATQRNHVIVHIRNKHLAPNRVNPRSDPNGTQIDPKDYVKVVHDLL